MQKMTILCSPNSAAKQCLVYSSLKNVRGERRSTPQVSVLWYQLRKRDENRQNEHGETQDAKGFERKHGASNEHINQSYWE